MPNQSIHQPRFNQNQSSSGQFNQYQPNQASFDLDKKGNALEKQIKTMIQIMQANQQETNSLKNIMG